MAQKPQQKIARNHKAYLAATKQWKRVRDCTAGSDAVKAAGTEYLPALGGHEGSAGQAKYDAYKGRALFYNATRRTRSGLSGVVQARPATLAVIETNKDAATQVVDNLQNKLVIELLTSSRCAIVVNQGLDEEQASASLWNAESIVNWRIKRKNGVNVLEMIVLEETYDDETDVECREVRRRHHYEMVDDVCGYAVWDLKHNSKEWVLVDNPKAVEAIGARQLDHLPCIIVDNDEINPLEIGEPMLIDLVDVNLSHYRNSADLEHGRHWCALPTAWATGFPVTDSSGNPIVFAIGGENAWITEQPGAQCGYLEFSGAGLGHIASGMADKQVMMAVLGARILEESKPSVEAAETIKTRMASERSALSTMAVVVSRALTWAHVEVVMWNTVQTEVSDTITLNSDFVDSRIDPGTLSALTAALQQGGISYQTYFTRLQKGELIPRERTIEEETELIDAGRPGNTPEPFAQGGGGGGRFGG